MFLVIIAGVREGLGVDAVVCGSLGGSDSKDKTLLAGWKPVYLSCVPSASACVLLGSVAGASRRIREGVAGESECVILGFARW